MRHNTFRFVATLFLGSLFFISCSKKPVKLEFSVIDSVYNVAGIEYPADYCKMEILENPLDRDSKIINIPVIRIRTTSNNPGAPIFILNDGPGFSNFGQIMPTWLADKHDIIIIGYRGVDGLVKLDIPEIAGIMQNPNFLSDNNLELAAKAFEKGIKKLEDKFEIDINQYNIYNIAQDLLSAQRAFKYEKINIYAVGYGARIAQIYSKIAPDAVFRLLIERPKSYGSLALSPTLIKNVFDYYADASALYNGGTTYYDNIFKCLDKLPAEVNGHRFDKDRILFQTVNSLNLSKGAALTNGAFKSALDGDYESLKFLEESFVNQLPNINFGDYMIKSITSEFKSDFDYVREFSYNSSKKLIGSPLAKFIFGSIQKSNFRPEILKKEDIDPDKLNGEVLMVIVNLDVFSPVELSEFNLKSKFNNSKSIVLTDYTPQDLYVYGVTDYSHLIANYLYSGNHYSYIPKELAINFNTDKTLKEISLERIQ